MDEGSGVQGKERGWEIALWRAYQHACKGDYDSHIYTTEKDLEFSLLAGKIFVIRGTSESFKVGLIAGVVIGPIILILLVLSLGQVLSPPNLLIYSVLFCVIFVVIIVVVVVYMRRFLAFGQGGFLWRAFRGTHFYPWINISDISGAAIVRTMVRTTYGINPTPISRETWPRIIVKLKSGETLQMDGKDYDLTQFPDSTFHSIPVYSYTSQGASRSLFFEAFRYYWDRARHVGIPSPPPAGNGVEVSDEPENSFSTPNPPVRHSSPETRLTTPFLTEVQDEGSCIIVTADLPGVDSKDIEVEVEGRELIISAGRLYKRITLPARVRDSGVKGRCNHGVLELRLEKQS